MVDEAAAAAAAAAFADRPPPDVMLRSLSHEGTSIVFAGGGMTMSTPGR